MASLALFVQSMKSLIDFCYECAWLFYKLLFSLQFNFRCKECAALISV